MPVLLIALGLAAASIGGELVYRASSRDKRIVVQQLWESDEHGELWRATELLSPEAVGQIGAMLDLSLSDWTDMARTGLYKIIVLANVGATDGEQCVFRARQDGLHWVLDVGFRPGNRKMTDEQVALAHEVIKVLDRQSAEVAWPGDLVVRRFEDGVSVVRIGSPMGLMLHSSQIGHDLTRAMMELQATRPGRLHPYKIMKGDEPIASFVIEKAGPGEFCIVESAGAGDGGLSTRAEAYLRDFMTDLTHGAGPFACPDPAPLQIEQYPAQLAPAQPQWIDPELEQAYGRLDDDDDVFDDLIDDDEFDDLLLDDLMMDDDLEVW